MDLDRTLCYLRKNTASLTILHLNQKGLSDNRHVEQLASALEHNTHVVIFFGSGNGITGGTGGATALARAFMHHGTLRQVGLSYNRLGPDGARALAAALGATSTNRLQVLQLSHNAIGDSGAVALSQALRHNVFLRKLELEDNEIAETGLTALAMALKENTKLTSLHLRGNSVTTQVQQVFFDVLQNDNQTLCTLELLSSEQQQHQDGKNDTGSLLSYDINFYLEWNRNGRQAFCSRQEITPEEWIHILEQLSATTSSGGVTAQAHSMVHAMIQARPDLFLSGVMKG